MTKTYKITNEATTLKTGAKIDLQVVDIIIDGQVVEAKFFSDINKATRWAKKQVGR